MSLVPHLLNEVFQDLVRPRTFRPGLIFDQNFGLGVVDEDLSHSHTLVAPLLSGYVRPWRHQATRKSGVSNIQNDCEGFKVNLDVQQFKPEEINVKIVDDFVVVEGKHEELEDEHGYISRQFQRRYRVPEDVDPDTVVSKLSSDGVLSIEAPKKAIEPPSKERVIQIISTNAPAATSKPVAVDVKKGTKKEDSTTEQMDQ